MCNKFYQKYKMFGLIKVPTMAYRPNTSVSIGSGGSVLFYKNENIQCFILVSYNSIDIILYQYPFSQHLL